MDWILPIGVLIFCERMSFLRIGRLAQVNAGHSAARAATSRPQGHLIHSQWPWGSPVRLSRLRVRGAARSLESR